MRQYFRWVPDIIDKLFLQIEVDPDIITVKAFHQIFPDGLPEYTGGINIVENLEDTITLSMHSIDFVDSEIQDIIPGEVLQNDNLHGLYFKFFGATQILRGTDIYGTEYVSLRTSNWDKGFGNNFGYKVSEFNEWTDCALWSFDFNFSGMNWYYPKNTFFDSIITKAHFVRNEFYNSYIGAPQLIKIEDEKSIFSSGETKKRLVSFFMFDKDDLFTDCSFYVKINPTLGCNLYLGGEKQSNSIWRTSIPLIQHYNNLPMPKIHINGPEVICRDEVVRLKVTLYDDEFYMLAEDGDLLVYENMDSRFTLEETTVEDLYNRTPMRDIGEDGTIADKYVTKKLIDMYVTTNMGYIAKRKLSLIDGIGYFTFRALDLEINDLVIIKVGTKTFSNMGSKTIKVIN